MVREGWVGVENVFDQLSPTNLTVDTIGEVRCGVWDYSSLLSCIDVPKPPKASGVIQAHQT